MPSLNKYRIPRLRTGSTSYLLHDSYVPAVRFTAERCDDVSLLLLETGPDMSWLPSPKEVAEMAAILDGEGAAIHVHMPTDLFFDTEADARKIVSKARHVIDLTAPLAPHSFVIHVDFLSQRNCLTKPPAKAISQEQVLYTRDALTDIASYLPSPDMLCVENLEGYPVSFWDCWLEDSPFSRCLDIGHIWKDSGDPLSVLSDWGSRLRVIHLHGLKKTEGVDATGHSAVYCRDHKSLALMPEEDIDLVMHPLWQQGFEGTLVLEVFSTEDFLSSHAALLSSWDRYCSRKEAS